MKAAKGIRNSKKPMVAWGAVQRLEDGVLILDSGFITVHSKHSRPAGAPEGESEYAEALSSHIGIPSQKSWDKMVAYAAKLSADVLKTVPQPEFSNEYKKADKHPVKFIAVEAEKKKESAKKKKEVNEAAKKKKKKISSDESSSSHSSEREEESRSSEDGSPEMPNDFDSLMLLPETARSSVREGSVSLGSDDDVDGEDSGSEYDQATYEERSAPNEEEVPSQEYEAPDSEEEEELAQHKKLSKDEEEEEEISKAEEGTAEVEVSAPQPLPPAVERDIAPLQTASVAVVPITASVSEGDEQAEGKGSNHSPA